VLYPVTSYSLYDLSQRERGNGKPIMMMMMMMMMMTAIFFTLLRVEKCIKEMQKALRA